MENLLNESVEHFHSDESHEHEEGGHDHGALVPKITAMCVLFVASTVVGLIPFKLSKSFNWDANTDAKAGTVVSSLLSFGGGVLLATTFLHLQPEIIEIIEHLQSEGKIASYKFSLAAFLMCCGFFIIYLIEELVHLYIESTSKKDTEAFTRGIHARESVLLRRKKEAQAASGNNTTISTTELVTEDIEKSVKNNNHCHDNHHHNHSHMPTLTDDNIVGNLKGLLIVLALSIHELFEGLAVGLEETKEGAWYFFGAVAAHKLVIAFCIGVELVAIRTKLKLSVIYVVTFAIVSPIGIGIGILLSESGGKDAFEVPSVILQGLASGTLLYVIFFEVLSKERSGLIQYVAVVVGFFIMFGLQYMTGHEHSHGGDHDHHHHLHHHHHDLDELSTLLSSEIPIQEKLSSHH